MDIAIIGENTIKIKSKRQTAVVLDPVRGMGKTEADAVIYSKKSNDSSDAKIEGSRIKIIGPGEYETGGTKIEGIKVDGNLAAVIEADGVKLLLGRGQEIKKIHERVGAFHIALINADSDFDFASLTSLEPNILMVYGPKKDEVRKSLGKNDVGKVSKFSATFDKLPEEMQFVLLE